VFCPPSANTRGTKDAEKLVKKKKTDKIKSAYKGNKKKTQESKNEDTEGSPLRMHQKDEIDEEKPSTHLEDTVGKEKKTDIEDEAVQRSGANSSLGQKGPDMKTKLEQCKRQMQKIYNKLEFNQHLNNKKALFINMRNYYTYCCGGKENVFDTLPLTFHIKSCQDDSEFSRF